MAPFHASAACRAASGAPIMPYASAAMPRSAASSSARSVAFRNSETARFIKDAPCPGRQRRPQGHPRLRGRPFQPRPRTPPPSPVPEADADMDFHPRSSTAHAARQCIAAAHARAAPAARSPPSAAFAPAGAAAAPPLCRSNGRPRLDPPSAAAVPRRPRPKSSAQSLLSPAFPGPPRPPPPAVHGMGPCHGPPPRRRRPCHAGHAPSPGRRLGSHCGGRLGSPRRKLP